MEAMYAGVLSSFSTLSTRGPTLSLVPYLNPFQLWCTSYGWLVYVIVQWPRESMSHNPAHVWTKASSTLFTHYLQPPDNVLHCACDFPSMFYLCLAPATRSITELCPARRGIGERRCMYIVKDILLEHDCLTPVRRSPLCNKYLLHCLPARKQHWIDWMRFLRCTSVALRHLQIRKIFRTEFSVMYEKSRCL